MKKSIPGVLAIFSHMDVLLGAIEKMKAEGHSDMTVYTPTPRHELDDAVAAGPSPVRRFTLIGGLLGATFGYVFTSFVSLDWILPTSGKPIVSLVAYTVIAFELTILFGSIFTIIGIILNAGLFRERSILYDDRFTEDKFGIFIPCQSDDYDEVSGTLKQEGAEEVQHA